MRGVAIIGIALHNYCHWLPGIIRENEYQFMQKNVDGALALGMHAVRFTGDVEALRRVVFAPKWP